MPEDGGIIENQQVINVRKVLKKKKQKNLTTVYLELSQLEFPVTESHTNDFSPSPQKYYNQLT